MRSNLKELIELVKFWGEDKGILSKGTKEKQVLKAQEEIGELVLAIGQNKRSDIIDGIGDSMVTLILLAEMCDTTLDECLYFAYQEIVNRKGNMVDGTFIKDLT